MLRDPHLTSCCGCHFCRSCVEVVLSTWGPCPLCKSTSFSTFLDKSFQRKVNELEILCPRTNDGCAWNGTVGTVESHLDVDCVYVEVECDLCSDGIQRKNYAEHKEDMCTKRPFTCEYCGYSKTWIEVTSKHSRSVGNIRSSVPTCVALEQLKGETSTLTSRPCAPYRLSRALWNLPAVVLNSLAKTVATIKSLTRLHTCLCWPACVPTTSADWTPNNRK